MEWEIREPTAEEVDEFKQCFDFYDKDKDGKVKPSEVGVMLRCVGKGPTSAEVTQLLTTLGRENPDAIDFDDFVLMAKQARPCPSTEEVTIALGSIFGQPGSANISAGELRDVMGNCGDDMSEEDINEVLREAGVPLEGEFDFKKFVRVLQGEESPDRPNPDDVDDEHSPNEDDA